MTKLRKMNRSERGRLRAEYERRLACPNRRFMTSPARSPNAPTIKPSRRKFAWMTSARLPEGSAVRIRGRRNEPMNAIPKIMTGNMAKEKLPNMVEWIRHSSFIMPMNRSSMAILPDKREEEVGQVLVSPCQLSNRPGMQQFPLVQDRKT